MSYEEKSNQFGKM